MGRQLLGALLVIARHHCPVTTNRSLLFRSGSTRLNPLHVLSGASKSNMAAVAWENKRDEAVAKCILPLTGRSHKGSSGRIAVIGGSERYTGAPYYAAMAALRTGVDLSTVFCAEEAAIPIKSYSPELMVQAIYSASAILENQDEIETAVEAVREAIDHTHCLVIGPGLGRSLPVMDAVQQIIKVAIEKKKYLVLDADALFMLSRYKDVLHGYDRVVLTPNIVEYKRMEKDGILEHTKEAVIVQKGWHDIISKGGGEMIRCSETGGLKRPGGIGDVLAGTTAALVCWHALQGDDLPLSCWTACCIVKRATSRAYEKKHRAMSAQDVIDEIGPVFEEMTK